MASVEDLKSKVAEIEKLLVEIKAGLEGLPNESVPGPKRTRLKEEVPSDDQLRTQYGALYEKFMAQDSATVRRFLEEKSKTYLRAFCKANNLPVDTTKASKIAIGEEVLKWMAQSKAITRTAI